MTPIQRARARAVNGRARARAYARGRRSSGQKLDRQMKRIEEENK